MDCLDIICLLHFPDNTPETTCYSALLILLFPKVSANLRKMSTPTASRWTSLGYLSSVSLQAPVKTSLYKYMENSIKERIVLGLEEYVIVHTLNSAYSVMRFGGSSS